jgi:hypothetical protein
MRKKKTLREIAATTKPSQPREASIVKACLDYLNGLSCAQFQKRHGARTRSGDPDIYGSLAGRHWEIEVKRPGKEPTERQYARLGVWSKAGAIVCWISSVDQLREIVDFWAGGRLPVPWRFDGVESNKKTARRYAHNLLG